MLKLSYERTTRLPRPDELFGDGTLLLENTGLVPEASHNANVGLELLPWATPVGLFTGNLVGSLREVDDLIQLFVQDGTARYENVDAARSWALHGGLGWTSPGEFVRLHGAATWLDFRNLASDGVFARFAGDRLPNRPWLQATGSARLQWKNAFAPDDAIALEWTARFVESFFRSWESAGRATTKAQVPAQLLHFAALSYRTHLDGRAFGVSLDVHNVTDAAAFDVVGVQRPGRAIHAKATLDL